MAVRGVLVLQLRLLRKQTLLAGFRGTRENKRNWKTEKKTESRNSVQHSSSLPPEMTPYARQNEPVYCPTRTWELP